MAAKKTSRITPTVSKLEFELVKIECRAYTIIKKNGKVVGEKRGDFFNVFPEDAVKNFAEYLKKAEAEIALANGQGA